MKLRSWLIFGPRVVYSGIASRSHGLGVVRAVGAAAMASDFIFSEAYMTTNLLKIATGSVMAVILLGCGVTYPTGSIYTASQVPSGINRNETSGPGKTGDKHGEACVTGILGVAAFGDGSLDAAKKAGGITEIHSIEFHGTNIVGVYQQGCTEVHGK
jgi:hypothetical protein